MVISVVIVIIVVDVVKMGCIAVSTGNTTRAI